MKKNYKIFIGAIIFVILIVVLYEGVNYQKIDTDKDVYKVGEEMIINITNLSFKDCHNLPFFNYLKKVDEGWKDLNHRFEAGEYCKNGIGDFYLGDYDPRCCSCRLNKKPFTRKTIKTKLIIWEYKGEEKCDKLRGGIEDKEYPSYKQITAPVGVYKIIYGNAEKIIEIK